ncbi:MAG: hypothetical protein ACI9QQ_001463 [Myxococcota bacterium]
MSSDPVLRETLKWVDDIVVGMGLCPFAGASIKADGLRLTLCAATGIDGLCRVLIDELIFLQSREGEAYDSSLLVHPNVLTDFAAFNEFLGMCEDILVGLSLEGEFQIASFHPDYCFADADKDDVGNYTNRSPYPTLHLLREASITKAIADYPDPASIPEKNVEKLEALGAVAMQGKLRGCKD